MKLLLTSGGITNDSIAKSLDQLTGLARSEVKIGFIPTAANAEPGNKDWYIRQISDLIKHQFTWIDFIDFSASNVAWKGRLEECQVLYVSGGNTFHLLHEVRKHRFDMWLKEHISQKVYVGTSAGSILMTPTISIAAVEPADTNDIGLTDLTGLSYVNFEVSPHTPEFLTHQANEEYAHRSNNPLYALDDNSAIQVIDEKVTVVSEGEWKEYTKQVPTKFIKPLTSEI